MFYNKLQCIIPYIEAPSNSFLPNKPANIKVLLTMCTIDVRIYFRVHLQMDITGGQQILF